MPITTDAPLVARKSITTIQEGSTYKERFVLPKVLATGTTVRMLFKDSSGADITEITGSLNGHYIEFEQPYSAVEEVPNGAGFYVYLKRPDPSTDEDMARYGTVFRRQLSFPDSPATLAVNQPRRYEDTFQRPAGAVGGRWKVLVGQPRIFDNADPIPNTVGPNYAFYARYFMRYYVPFASDTVTLSISAIDKGSGKTVIALGASSDCSSYIYAMFNSASGSETLTLGIGHGPDIGVGGNLEPQIAPVALVVPDNDIATFKMRYDDVTGVLGFYNDDYTVEYASWEDSSNLAPHGKGYRYFGVGGEAGLFNSGVQVAYINAQDDV